MATPTKTGEKVKVVVRGKTVERTVYLAVYLAVDGPVDVNPNFIKRHATLAVACVYADMAAAGRGMGAGSGGVLSGEKRKR
eukprot:gene17351-23655_t